MILKKKKKTLPMLGRKRKSTPYQFAYRVVAIMLTLTFVIATTKQEFSAMEDSGYCQN